MTARRGRPKTASPAAFSVVIERPLSPFRVDREGPDVLIETPGGLRLYIINRDEAYGLVTQILAALARPERPRG